MQNEASLEQSRRLSCEMAHWLELFDEVLGQDEVRLSQRPMRALLMLFEHSAIEIEAEGAKITLTCIGEHTDKPWFRVLYAAVEYWFVEHYGRDALARGGNASLEGMVLIRNTPFTLRIPANRYKIETDGELTWMYFEEGLGEGEVAHDWIVKGPNLSLLAEDARASVKSDALIVASTLRFVEFRRVMARVDGNEEVRRLVLNTLASLQQAARRMVGGHEADRGPGWYDLQMANESALKAVIQHNSQKQPKTHKLDDLLAQTSEFGVVFDNVCLEKFPTPTDVTEWRYGQGEPWRLERQYQAYLITLDLVRAAMEQIPPGMSAGFGLQLRYPPWLSDSGKAERG